MRVAARAQVGVRSRPSRNPKEERTLRARWLVTAVSIASLSVGVSACGGGGGGGGPTAKIKGTSLTVYSSLPEQGASGDQAKAIEDGVKLAVKDRSGKVGKYSITYKPLDDSLGST